MDVPPDSSAWRSYGGSDFPALNWTADGDGLKALAHAPQVDLISRGRYRDFDLSLQWRLPVGGNSGLLYRVDESFEYSWQSGPEMQLLDNGGHPDGRVAETSCGALYGLYAPQRTESCPPERFHSARIRVRGSQVEHWLNDVLVLACDLAGEDFRRRAAASKFRAFPHFAAAPEGHIVLQHHGTDAWFRNIRISAPA